jgi:hypothetical protein
MPNRKLHLLFSFLVCILLILVSGAGAGSQPRKPTTIEWIKTYGSTQKDHGSYVQETEDAGFIIVGTYGQTSSGTGGLFYLLKTDSSGNIEWDHTYGNPNAENVGKCVLQTDDGGYIAAGYTGNDPYYNGVVFKTDGQGNAQWNHTYGSVSSQFTCIQRSYDGYAMSGTTYSYSTGSFDMWLVKINETGNEEWEHTYGDGSYDCANWVCAEWPWYLLGGLTGINNCDAFVIFTNEDGDQIMSQHYGGSGHDEVACIEGICHGCIKTWDFIGTTQEDYGSDTDIWYVSLNYDGSIAWQTTFGTNDYDYATGFSQSPNNNILITGQTGYNAYLIRLDDNLHTIWQETIQHGSYSIANSGMKTRDSGFIAVGDSGYDQSDILLVKIEKNNPPNMPSNPNPANDAINVSLTPTLSWSCSDPDGDPIHYYLALGTTPNPPIIATNIQEPTFQPPKLADNTRYYWIVTAFDTEGVTQGPLWSFVTKSTLQILDMKGGYGVHFIINNIGMTPVHNLSTNLVVTGGTFHHIQQNITKTYPSLNGGASQSCSGLVFGFGSIDIKVNACCDESTHLVEKTASGKIMFCWILLRPA